MSTRRRATSRTSGSRQVAVYLAAHLVAHVSEVMLLGDSPQLEREMLKRARELVRLLEGRLLDERRPKGKNVVDMGRRLRLRAIRAAMGISEPTPPPRAA
jgi:hypothetical protein